MRYGWLSRTDMRILQTVRRLVIRHAGVLGSFAFSLANFAVLFVLQREVSPFDFGIFALSQVFVQFGIGLSNAMFCSPIVVLISEKPECQRSTIASFSGASLLFSAAGAVFVGFVIYLMDGRIPLAVLFSALCLLSWTRWYFRSVELASRNYLSPVWADMLYSVAVMIGAGAVVLIGAVSVEAATAIQVLGCLAAFLSLGPLAFRAISDAFCTNWAPFMESMKRHGKWALLGVVTTETTANIHSYIVGFALGPAAFAPIAAVNLFYRPVTILAQALTQFERPRMAESLAKSDFKQVRREVGQFRLISLLVWAGNAVLVLALITFFPQFIGNEGYDLTALQVSAAILAVIFLARSLRGAESAALQAAGYFRPLAIVTVITAPITLALVTLAVFVILADATWSLVGIAVGEILMCTLIARLFASRIPTGAEEETRA